MKKIILTIVMMAAALTALRAQYTTRISTDTMPCGVRQPNYYYSAWYDTTEWYLYGSALDSIHVYNDGRDTFYYHWSPYHVGFGGINNAQAIADLTHVYQQYAPHPIRIKGIWAMVSQYAGNQMNSPDGGNIFPIFDSARVPEYFYLYVRNAGWDSIPDSILLDRVATLRWDTSQPKMMCIQKTLDPTFAGANAYCHVYEALFDTVYTIEGEYFLGGSQRSNSLEKWGTIGHKHFPTLYLTFGRGTIDRMHDPYAMRLDALYGPDGPFRVVETSTTTFGPFGVITDGQRYVEVSSSDTSQGMGFYTAFYPDSTYQTITAEPSRGYRFSHWNDSVTDNPRTIFVTSDTSFTAYFASLPEYRVDAGSSDEELGRVTGGGPYYEGETARLEARANRGGRFVCWNDSVTDNPRTVVVTGDTVFTANFVALDQYSLEVYSNNEAYGTVTGGGTFYDGEEPLIMARPNGGYYLLRWDDGPTFISRNVVMTQDTSITAIFWPIGVPVGVQGADEAGVQFRLVPNPASSEVRLEVAAEGFRGGVLAVADAAGREVLRRELKASERVCEFRVADLPAGTYFVTLTTKEGTSTRKLVVE